MSQMFGGSVPLISALERTVQPVAPRLANSTQPLITVNSGDGNKLSAWQQAVLRCIARPIAPVVRKIA